MSAAIVHVGRSAAYAIADRGAFNDDGRMRSNRRKLHVSTPLKLAMTMQGPLSEVMHDALDEWMEAQPDQQAALAGLPNMLGNLHALMIAAKDHSGSQKTFRLVLQLYVACWSEARERPECYVMASAAGSYLPDRVKPLSLHPCVAYWSPDVPSYTPHPGFAPYTEGLALIEAQRRTPDELGRYIVGGAAELATVDTTGVTIETLHTWEEDRVGERIEPAGFPTTLSALACSNN